jgi:hypothetical protein
MPNQIRHSNSPAPSSGPPKTRLSNSRRQIAGSSADPGLSRPSVNPYPVDRFPLADPVVCREPRSVFALIPADDGCRNAQSRLVICLGSRFGAGHPARTPSSAGGTSEIFWWSVAQMALGPDEQPDRSPNRDHVSKGSRVDCRWRSALSFETPSVEAPSFRVAVLHPFRVPQQRKTRVCDEITGRLSAPAFSVGTTMPSPGERGVGEDVMAER